MGDFEAAGDLVTGALLGRAVEPRAGEHHGHDHGTICLNCGTALVGDFCYACGQAGHVHRSLGAIGHEILHGVAHFEGKLWRTLPLLAWQPGDLTRRYIAGERARFVSPMAIFLFSIFLMFTIFQILGISTPAEIPGMGARPIAAIEDARGQALKARAKAIEQRNDPKSDAKDKIEAGQDVADADAHIKAFDLAAAQIKAAGADTSPENEVIQVHVGWHALDHGVEKWKKNPSLMLYKLQSSIYKFSWLLIPLSLPFVWLLFFWKRQYKLYDHTVFITYSIAFMSLLFIVVTLGNAVGVSGGVLGSIAMFVPPIHLCRQLKQAYRLRWWSAILRTAILLFFIAIVVTLFLSLLMVMGMMG